MNLRKRTSAAIEQGKMSGRLWLYSNYHCNLACKYCITESAPSSPKRGLSKERMLRLSQQAKELGFTGIGITGGEPFLLPTLVDLLNDITDILPVTVLTNGTLFNPRRLKKLQILVSKSLRFQISLDRPDPIQNDSMRGPQNFAKVLDAVPKLIDIGLQVRIASTIDHQTPQEEQRLRDLVEKMGVPTEDHVIRKVVSRGRAVTENLGVSAPLDKLPPELTISADGAFYSPFGPTIKRGKLQTDLLLCRVTSPLSKPTAFLLDFLDANNPADGGEEITGFV